VKITVRNIWTGTDGREEEIEDFVTSDPHAAEEMVAVMAKRVIVTDDERFDGPGTLHAGRVEWFIEEES
jgi:hypothetical protein